MPARFTSLSTKKTNRSIGCSAYKIHKIRAHVRAYLAVVVHGGHTARLCRAATTQQDMARWQDSKTAAAAGQDGTARRRRPDSKTAMARQDDDNKTARRRQHGKTVTAWQDDDGTARGPRYKMARKDASSCSIRPPWLDFRFVESCNVEWRWF
jgi:hypothetical protein